MFRIGKYTTQQLKSTMEDMNIHTRNEAWAAYNDAVTQSKDFFIREKLWELYVAIRDRKIFPGESIQ